MGKFLMRLFTGLHGKLVKTTGWFGGGTDDGSVLVLEHIGAKSGKRRETPLMFVTHNGGYAVCGSMAGAPQNPAWYHNLKANPEVNITVDKATIPVRARELDGEERRQVWERFAAMDDRWEQYARRTDRELPLVALEPR